MQQQMRRCAAGGASRPGTLPRPTCARPSSSRRVQCQVQFNPAFLAQLNESLDRQGDQIAEQVGLPGMTLKQKMADASETSEDDGCNTGTMVWSAGLRLASHLVKNRRELINGARVLEVGSGTGVVGIACAMLGAHVILTDQESILQGTFDNVQANMELIEGAGGSAQVAPLDWSNPDDEVFEIPYDWVLGSDVTYEIDSIPNLAAVLSRLVDANPDAVVKLAHRHRNKDLDKTMREIFAAFGLVLRPVDVRTTGTSEYADPIKVDKSIVFFRVFKQ